MKSLIYHLLILGIIFPIIMKAQEIKESNPFFEEYTTPYKTPPFSKIKDEHYLPAFLKGIGIEKEEIQRITNHEAKPTFKNTIEELQKAGKLLTKVSRVFSNISGANSNPQIQKIAEEVTPQLSKLRDAIYLNDKLFARIKSIYNEKESLSLSKEELKLLNDYYTDFIRSGIAIDEKNKNRLKEINEELSVLGLKFGNNLRSETNAIGLVIENEDDLIGLPESVIKGAQELAEKNDLKGKWAFNLQRPSFTPFLQYSQKRELREILYKAYLNRGNNGNQNDNNEVIAKITPLRIEKIKLLGYSDYAEYKLEKNMAKNSESVLNFLNDLWEPSLSAAKSEVVVMQKLSDAEGGNFKLAAWDWWYYSEKVKKEKYDLDENMLRPYFKMENVRQGAFDVASKLFDITFEKIDNVDVYQPDVEVYEVKESDGTHIGVLYTDYFPRSGKRAGAWMSYYRGQSNIDNDFIAPLVVNVGNFSKPTEDQPALLSYDEVMTLFHEFGHGLNGLFGKSVYPGSKRSPVDFVELPSQIMENWASEPEVLKMYAKHYQTGEVIPDELIQKIQNSQYFNKGFTTTEYLAACFLDMDWHTLNEAPSVSPEEFEKHSLDKLGLIPEVASRYQSTNFNHIFGGDGYSAGYYGYIWAQVLDADAFQAFAEIELFNRELGESFRRNILEKSGSDDPMILYKNFRGREPKADALIKRLGFDN